MWLGLLCGWQWMLTGQHSVQEGQRHARLQWCWTHECCFSFTSFYVQALRCLNLDKNRSIKVFTNVSGDSAVNNLAVVACGIALAAHSLAASGAELPISGAGSSSSGASSGNGGDQAGSSGGEAGDGPEARRQLQQEAAEFLRFLADT